MRSGVHLHKGLGSRTSATSSGPRGECCQASPKGHALACRLLVAPCAVAVRLIRNAARSTDDWETESSRIRTFLRRRKALRSIVSWCLGNGGLDQPQSVAEFLLRRSGGWRSLPVVLSGVVWLAPAYVLLKTKDVYDVAFATLVVLLYQGLRLKASLAAIGAMDVALRVGYLPQEARKAARQLRRLENWLVQSCYWFCWLLLLVKPVTFRILFLGEQYAKMPQAFAWLTGVSAYQLRVEYAEMSPNNDLTIHLPACGNRMLPIGQLPVVFAPKVHNVEHGSHVHECLPLNVSERSAFHFKRQERECLPLWSPVEWNGPEQIWRVEHCVVEKPRTENAELPQEVEAPPTKPPKRTNPK